MPHGGLDRGDRWIFVLNNYTDDELRLISLKPDPIIYIIFGKEIGSNGTPHLQGYLELTKRMRLTAVKKLLCERMHLQLAKGSLKDNQNYCSKGNQPKEEWENRKEYGPNFGLNCDVTTWGEPKIVINQAKRIKKSLDECKELIDSGMSVDSLADIDFGKWVIYRKPLEAYAWMKLKKISRTNLKVILIHGAAGVGKSRWAFTKFPELFPCPNPSLIWFDGYKGERVVLIDDYRGRAEPAFILRLLDIYPLAVPVKGGYVPWLPTTIIVTSNMALPFGSDDPSFVPALTRRFHKVVHLNETRKYRYKELEELIDYENIRTIDDEQDIFFE